VEKALKSPSYVFDFAFEIILRITKAKEITRTRFFVHHSIRGDLMSTPISIWAMDQKIVPWVAVAAPLTVRYLLNLGDNPNISID
jgi:sacsin